jgi:hypothetical protein
VAGSCEYIDEISGSVKGGTSDKLTNTPSKIDCAAWS